MIGLTIKFSNKQKLSEWLANATEFQLIRDTAGVRRRDSLDKFSTEYVLGQKADGCTVQLDAEEEMDRLMGRKA